jgi:hypothetical protein
MITAETDYLEIGSTPCDEPCVPAGSDSSLAKKECRALMNQLKRMYGEPPETARFKIKSNPHDFGTYYELSVVYAIDNEEGMNYALKCESLPENWDEQAKLELGTDWPEIVKKLNDEVRSRV